MNHLRIRRSGVRISPGALDRSLASAGDLLVLATNRMLSSGETGSLHRCGLRSESMVTREMWSCRPCDRPLELTVDGDMTAAVENAVLTSIGWLQYCH